MKKFTIKYWVVMLILWCICILPYFFLTEIGDFSIAGTLLLAEDSMDPLGRTVAFAFGSIALYIWFVVGIKTKLL